ncbi:N-lysine methyltransferase KMT5A-A isoform X2 [Channa argus]|uniref:N-lysine methyltransferase KMT5A-A isoform X2 n=1 Tax=Channa argus TaxID=215402 RepID=UPI0035222E0A
MRSHENKSDMSGDIVHNSHSVTLLSSANSATTIHNKKKIKLKPEEPCSPSDSQQNEVARQEEGWRPNTISTTPKDSKSQCSSCWKEEHSSPPQHFYPATCFRSTTEAALPLSNSLSHAVHTNTNNSTALHSRRQRREVRPKVIGKKQPIRRIAAGKNSQNRKVTDYYPIRRSSRKSKTELKYEQKKLIDELITNGIEVGMKVQHIEGKGRAVFATRCFQKGEYVVEYHGDLLHITDAKKREAEYAQNPATGCYMYYFQYLCKTYWCVCVCRCVNSQAFDS